MTFLTGPPLLQGERLSHAVGCAFAACLERKQRREKECGVTAAFDASRTSFAREGSFRLSGGGRPAEREAGDKKKGGCCTLWGKGTGAVGPSRDRCRGVVVFSAGRRQQRLMCLQGTTQF